MKNALDFLARKLNIIILRVKMKIILLVLLMLASAQSQAKFLTPDPVKPNSENGQNFNRYWYADNNPIKNVDADG